MGVAAFDDILGILNYSLAVIVATVLMTHMSLTAEVLVVKPAVLIGGSVLVGLIFGVEANIGLLTAALVSGFVLAIMLANAGASWDNAKKYIEEGNLGGKGSDAHKATVVSDTVGDPCKDTAGPSINILIKLMSMASIVFAAFVLKNSLLP